MAMIITDDQNYKDIALAIREKNGEDILYKPNEMANAVRGLSSLNFEVVGGTAQPENPKENTIWVNTSNEITGYSFQNVTPENPSEGFVWFKTGSGEIVFNALCKDTIQVRPMDCRQYIGGVFVQKPAQIYQNGTASMLYNGLLYNAGNPYTAVTGGWKIHYSTSSASITSAASYLSIDYPYVSYCGVGPVNKINTTGFTKLCANVKVVSSSGGYQGLRFGCTPNMTGSANGHTTVTHYKDISASAGTYTAEVPIEGLDSEVYIMLLLTGAINIQITKVWME